jgi:5-formyltetrahydrofolate cyclo-ligase
LLAQRYSLSAAHKAVHTAGILDAALSMLAALPAGTEVALFYPHAGEPNLLALAHNARTAHLQFALPVVVAKDQALRFARWAAHDALRPDAYAIAVPAVTQWISPRVLLVPCVGVCQQAGSLYRLGYGGGYYDRTLVALRSLGAPVLAVGVAWPGARAHFAPAPHDVPLDALLTAPAPTLGHG